MAVYCVGDFLRDARESRGITQEELSEGICSVSTLSKIENGNVEPSRRVYQALMQRLGENAELFSRYEDEKEMHRFQHCVRILRAIAKEDAEEIGRLIEEYRPCVTESNLPGTQFVLFTQAVYHIFVGEAPEKVLEELEAALRITIPVYESRKNISVILNRKYFTFSEFYILNNIGVQLWKMGKAREAERLFRFLMERVEAQIMDEEEKARIYPAVLGNCAMICLSDRRFAEAVVLCEQGIRICTGCGKLYALPCLLACKACGLAAHGKRIEARRCLKQARSIEAAGKGSKTRGRLHFTEKYAKSIILAL